jgi:magnesium chelatase family protein
MKRIQALKPPCVHAGPPEVGKARLARRLTTILLPLPLAQALDITRLSCIARLTGARTAVVITRPCRTPPHTIAEVGLIGGVL